MVIPENLNRYISTQNTKLNSQNFSVDLPKPNGKRIKDILDSFIKSKYLKLNKEDRHNFPKLYKKFANETEDEEDLDCLRMSGFIETKRAIKVLITSIDLFR